MPSPDRPTLGSKDVIDSPTRIRPPSYERTGHVPKDLRNWIAEIKPYGMQVMVFISPTGVRVLTTGDRNISQSFPKLSSGFAQIAQRHSAILDGEIIYGAGKTPEDYHKVRGRSVSDKPSPREDDLYSFMAFDILHLDGQFLTHQPLLERKRALAKLLHPSLKKFNIAPIYFERTPPKITSLLDKAEKEGFEIVAFRRKGSRYNSQANWLRMRIPRSGAVLN